MKATHKNRSYKPVASALLMLVALLWLTVSTPFVYACQQQVAAAAKKEGAAKAAQTNNPLSGTNEEKPESGTSNLSEYLHEIVLPGHVSQPQAKYEKCHSSNLYLAFHPELLCPPPNSVG